MPLFRKRPIQIEAHRWFNNGDHPEDESSMIAVAGPQKPFLSEGKIVRRFNHPNESGQRACDICDMAMRRHGWIDTMEGGHVVCPGDWIITGIKNEKYPCKPDIFEASYEEVIA